MKGFRNCNRGACRSRLSLQLDAKIFPILARASSACGIVPGSFRGPQLPGPIEPCGLDFRSIREPRALGVEDHMRAHGQLGPVQRRKAIGAVGICRQTGYGTADSPPRFQRVTRGLHPGKIPTGSVPLFELRCRSPRCRRTGHRCRRAAWLARRLACTTDLRQKYEPDCGFSHRQPGPG